MRFLAEFPECLVLAHLSSAEITGTDGLVRGQGARESNRGKRAFLREFFRPAGSEIILGRLVLFCWRSWESFARSRDVRRQPLLPLQGPFSLCLHSVLDMLPKGPSEPGCVH